MSDYLDVNRANWDDRVPIHAASRFYNLDAWLAAPKHLQPWETEFIGDVDGLDVAHLQCHIGTDTLALALGGARVTGLDFSPAAIAQARELASKAGLADRAKFVESDVYAASDVLPHASFDLVYVSLGALCWIPSVERWAEQVARLLKTGGRLYLHDGHPLPSALGWEDGQPTLQVAQSYFEEADPWTYESDVTYTDGEGRMAHTKMYEWNHSIGEIVNAAVGFGLRIDCLVEHDWTVCQAFPDMTPSDDGRWFTSPGTPRFPQSFTLLATKA